MVARWLVPVICWATVSTVVGRSLEVNWHWNEAIRDDSYFAGVDGTTNYILDDASSLPTGVTFNSATGGFLGIPMTVCSVGSCTEKFTAIITTGLDVSTIVKVTVMNSPIYVIDNQEGTQTTDSIELEESGLTAAVLTAIIVTAGILFLAVIVAVVYCFVSRSIGAGTVRQIKLENSGFDYNEAVADIYPLETVASEGSAGVAPRQIMVVNRSAAHQAKPATPIKVSATVLGVPTPKQSAASPATTIQTIRSPKPDLSSLAVRTESYTAATSPTSAAAATATPVSAEDAMPDEMQLWFAGNIRRTVCEQAVRNANHGDFIIRQSRGSDTYVLCINDSGAPSSFQININDGESELKFEFANGTFKSLTKVVAFLRKTPMTGRTGQLLYLASPITSDDLDAATKEVSTPGSVSSSIASSVAKRDRAMTRDRSQPVWHVGLMPRKLVEKFVVQAWHTAFLIRQSSQGEAYVLCINDQGAATNFHIKVVSGKYIFSNEAYDSLDAIIKVLQKTPISGRTGPLCLGLPAPTKSL